MNNRGTPDVSLTGTSQPRAAGGTQSNYDSPPSDDAAAEADGGDSACSREDNRDPEMPQRDSGASSYGRQVLICRIIRPCTSVVLLATSTLLMRRCLGACLCMCSQRPVCVVQHLNSEWQSKSAQEARLSRAAWNMVEQAANAAATSQWNPHEWAKPPQRAFSAGQYSTFCNTMTLLRVAFALEMCRKLHEA